MGTKINKLTDRKIQASKAGSLIDGGGLRVIISPSGAKKFVFRWTVDKKTKEVGFGGYPSSPALSAAWALRLPRMIQEQNGVLSLSRAW